MPASNMLVVLVARDAGLRSTLSARLSLVGADIVTARDVHDPGLERSVRGPAVLVIEDEVVVARSPEWLRSLLDDSRWRRVVVLNGASVDCDDPRLLCLDRQIAAAALAELLPRWQAEDGE